MRMLIIGGVAALALAACGDQAGQAKKTGDTIATASGIEAALGDHKAFAALVEQAGIADAIDGPGSYTVFAPANAAMREAVASGSDDTAARQAATALVVAHIAPGAMTRADLSKAVAVNGGTTVIRTMGGTLLDVTEAGGKLMLAPEGGSPVALDVKEVQSGDDMVIGIAAPLTGG